MSETKILFFGILRDLAGKGEANVILPTKIHDCQTLIDWLTLEDPSLREALNRPTTKISIDGEITSREATLLAPTEIAFLPPFSGG